MPAWVEVVGYVASALIVVSLAMRSTLRLRIINLLGCLAFVIYGSIIHAWPVVVSNAIIVCLNIYYLVQYFRTRRDVGVVPVAPDAPYLQDFLAANANDIREFQPTFSGLSPDSLAWLLMRDGLPVGVFAGRRDGDVLRVEVDHVTPSYRDSRLGQWLHSDGSKVFRDAGIRALVADPGTITHREYLGRVGFHADGSSMRRDL